MSDFYDQLPKRVKERWLRHLRSGKYVQTYGKSHDIYTDARCAMGVLCKAFEKNYRYRNTLKIPPNIGKQVIRLNDDLKWSFKRIANWLEKNV